MTDWKERAERAEAELARLRALLTRAVDHVSYGSRRSYDGVGGYKMREAASQLLLEIMAALAALYRAAPPAQPAEQQAQTVCKRTLIELDARLRECSIVGASAADAYDTFYQHMVETALAAQPAEPVQRLSDAGIEALAGKHGTTYRNRHFPTQPAFSFSNGSLHRFVRDIESALQPGWRDIESAPKDGTHVLLWCQTHIQKGVQAMPFTGRWFSGGPWIIVNADMAIQRVEPTHWMALPPAPKATK